MTAMIALDIDIKMRLLPPRSTIVVRKGRQSPLGTLESVAVAIAKTHKHMVLYCQPDGNDRASVYKRDYEMVESVDRLEAYFAPDRIMDGGTGHLVEAAIARETPVYAWSIADSGHLIRVGENEPHAV